MRIVGPMRARPRLGRPRHRLGGRRTPGEYVLGASATPPVRLERGESHHIARRPPRQNRGRRVELCVVPGDERTKVGQDRLALRPHRGERCELVIERSLRGGGRGQHAEAGGEPEDIEVGHPQRGEAGVSAGRLVHERSVRGRQPADRPSGIEVGRGGHIGHVESVAANQHPCLRPFDLPRRFTRREPELRRLEPGSDIGVGDVGAERRERVVHARLGPHVAGVRRGERAGRHDVERNHGGIDDRRQLRIGRHAADPNQCHHRSAHDPTCEPAHVPSQSTTPRHLVRSTCTLPTWCDSGMRKDGRSGDGPVVTVRRRCCRAPLRPRCPRSAACRSS